MSAYPRRRLTKLLAKAYCRLLSASCTQNLGFARRLDQAFDALPADDEPDDGQWRTTSASWQG